MERNKVLVTGGTGFIGSSLVRKLVAEDYNVKVFDNNSRGATQNLNDIIDKIEIIEGDIRSFEDVYNASIDCSTIMHLAFINGTKFFYEKPELVLEVGTKGALNTLDAAIKHGIDKYILASSSEVYQEPLKIPTDETERIIIPDVKNPRYSYSGGKIISELLTINYLNKENIKYSIFRPHNFFGPCMGFEHVIPEIMKKIFIASNKFQSQICDIENQGSGEESRAFCFIDDGVDQIFEVLKNGENGEIYHLGMNEEKTIKEFILDIGKALNIEINIKKGQLKKGGTSRRCPDISKVTSIGYKVINHYYEGLEKTVNWYKQYFINNFVSS